MGREIERTYLVRGDGWRDEVVGSSHIRQGYLHVDDDGQVRVRIRDGRATLTVKRGGTALDRLEVEVPLDLEAAEQLLAEALVGRVLDKRRHEVPAGDLVIEVDEFAAPYAQLVVAEVELPTAGTPAPDRPWLGDEVTGDPRYANATLATG